MLRNRSADCCWRVKPGPGASFLPAYLSLRFSETPPSSSSSVSHSSLLHLLNPASSRGMEQGNGRNAAPSPSQNNTAGRTPTPCPLGAGALLSLADRRRLTTEPPSLLAAFLSSLPAAPSLWVKVCVCVCVIRTHGTVLSPAWFLQYHCSLLATLIWAGPNQARNQPVRLYPSGRNDGERRLFEARQHVLARGGQRLEGVLSGRQDVGGARLLV